MSARCATVDTFGLSSLEAQLCWLDLHKIQVKGVKRRLYTEFHRNSSIIIDETGVN